MSKDSSYQPTLADAQDLFDCAQRCREEGDYKQCLSLHAQALTIREANLGNTHPDVIPSLMAMASVCRICSHNQEAKSLYLRALAVSEEASGDATATAALIYNDLAHVYCDEGNFDEAAWLLSLALRIKRKLLPPTHPGICFALKQLAIACRLLDLNQDAQGLLEEAAKTGQAAWGAGHEDYIETLKHLGCVYTDLGKLQQAKMTLERALVLAEEHFPADDPRLKAIRLALAQCYVDLAKKLAA